MNHPFEVWRLVKSKSTGDPYTVISRQPDLVFVQEGHLSDEEVHGNRYEGIWIYPDILALVESRTPKPQGPPPKAGGFFLVKNHLLALADLTDILSAFVMRGRIP